MAKLMNIQPINMKEIAQWSSMPYWTLLEALILSMRVFDEEAKQIDISKDNSLTCRQEYESRYEILQRAEQIGQVKFHPVESTDPEICGQKVPVLDPVDFVNWAVEYLPSISIELCDEVRTLRSKKKQKKLDCSKVGNAGSDARWAEIHSIITKAEYYVKDSVKNGCEECDHYQLAKYMFYMAIDDQGNPLFNYPKLEDSTLLKYLKEGAKIALEKYPTRIVGKKGYKKSEGDCEVHPTKRK